MFSLAVSRRRACWQTVKGRSIWRGGHGQQGLREVFSVELTASDRAVIFEDCSGRMVMVPGRQSQTGREDVGPVCRLDWR